MKKELQIRENFWEDMQKYSDSHVHIILIGTKPDIIKQAPLYLELKKRGEGVVLVHTGQHYDYNLSGGVLDEFDMVPDIYLGISGGVHDRYAQIVQRFGDIIVKLQEKNITPIPYVHGDTLTAASADRAAFLNRVAVVHVEAGIRTHTPNKQFFTDMFQRYEQGGFDFEEYRKALTDISIYERGSMEPYPEQFDTRSVSACAGLHMAPVELYRQTLTLEGLQTEDIHVVGNTVADAILYSQSHKNGEKVFEKFPQLEWKDFIFVTIHRRENCLKKDRFMVLYNTLKQLVLDGVPVCFLQLPASENAINTFGLRKDIEQFAKDHSDMFVYQPCLAEHAEVIHAITHAGAVVTDSGSMQEEANIVGTPCVTLRFGSDRIETVLAGTNVLCPPVNTALCVDIIKGVVSHWDMKQEMHLYGKNVSVQIVDCVLKKIEKYGTLFLFEDERLELQQYISY